MYLFSVFRECTSLDLVVINKCIFVLFIPKTQRPSGLTDIDVFTKITLKLIYYVPDITVIFIINAIANLAVCVFGKFFSSG